MTDLKCSCGHDDGCKYAHGTSSICTCKLHPSEHNSEPVIPLADVQKAIDDLQKESIDGEVEKEWYQYALTQVRRKLGV